MDLTPYVANLRHELAVAAEASDEDARALAERLAAALESAVRLTLLDALSAAADEITRDLAPGSVELRLRGREPAFVVTPPPAAAEPQPVPAPAPAPETDDGTTSRINFRLPENLKLRVEAVANREGLSVNAWLVRAAAAAVDPGHRPSDCRASGNGGRYTGWVR